MITEQDPGFEALLEHLTRYRGIDFSGYKQPSLIRRVVSRMRVAGVGDCVDYLAYLDEHPAEYTTLFDSILINVTGFFRDEAAWGYVRETLLPKLLASKPVEEPVRVWSAGCASGEEVYTLAMLFAGTLIPTLGPKRAQEFVLGYILELSLSMDNVFVIALIFAYFRVPLQLQHRVLFWGVLGAFVMRGLMIAAVGVVFWILER